MSIRHVPLARVCLGTAYASSELGLRSSSVRRKLVLDASPQGSVLAPRATRMCAAPAACSLHYVFRIWGETGSEIGTIEVLSVPAV